MFRSWKASSPPVLAFSTSPKRWVGEERQSRRERARPVIDQQPRVPRKRSPTRRRGVRRDPAPVGDAQLPDRDRRSSPRAPARPTGAPIPPLGSSRRRRPAPRSPAVNPRVNPFTGQPLDLREGAYDRSGSIKVKGNGSISTLNKTIERFHAHLRHLVPVGGLQEPGRRRRLDQEPLHPGLLRKDQGVLAGSAPHEPLRRPFQLHRRSLLLSRRGRPVDHRAIRRCPRGYCSRPVRRRRPMRRSARPLRPMSMAPSRSTSQRGDLSGPA